MLKSSIKIDGFKGTHSNEGSGCEIMSKKLTYHRELVSLLFQSCFEERKGFRIDFKCCLFCTEVVREMTRCHYEVCSCCTLASFVNYFSEKNNNLNFCENTLCIILQGADANFKYWILLLRF